jgi:carboxypeptidase C (cathepsin A)
MNDEIQKTTRHKHNKFGMEYDATVGIMPLYDAEKKLLATMSYMAYLKNSDKDRPITFIWGGGPGYCSLIDNFAMTGPMIFNSSSKSMEESSQSWLEFTDLVYIDMIGSGWGRLATQDNAELFYSPAGDAESFSQFIENFLRAHQRLSSPLYLAGSSYGGCRAPIVAKNLLRATLPVRGMFLASPLLSKNYHTPCEFGSDMPYVLALPTYIRAALYHKKLSEELLSDPEKTLKEGIEWSQTEYPILLLQGDSLSESKQQQLAEKLHSYTDLDVEMIRKNHFRISLEVYCSHLLGDKNVNYLDVRFSDHELTDFYGYFIFTMSNLMELQLNIYPHAMDYIAKHLEFSMDQQYVVYKTTEDWYSDPAYNQVISILRDCLLIDEKLKVFVGLGYFDIDIPYMSNIAAVNHLLLPAEARSRVHLKCYAEGHMFGLTPESQKLLHDDIKDILF